MSLDFVYRNWRRLGAYNGLDGHVKFAMSTIQRHLQRKAREAKPSRWSYGFEPAGGVTAR